MNCFIRFFVFFIGVFSAFTQSKFQFYGDNDLRTTVKFELVNNLIVLPIDVNGEKLSFILDSGVNKTILFNLNEKDSLELNSVKKIQLRGLGDGDSIEALLSKMNTMSIQNYKSVDEEIYVILKDKFDVSGRMGITIHGIIGYTLLKDAIVKIDYKNKKIHFYNPQKYTYKKCTNCEQLPLEFYRKKPYVNVYAKLDSISDKQTAVKLLIDTGGSEAFWLFEGSKEEIITPKKYFRDVLGEGLSGTIYGNRSRIKGVTLGKFEVVLPTVSFLDSLSTHNARLFKSRNGSIGGAILKRFKIWLDYPNKKIILKKCSSLKNGFEYNMSGLDVIYDGKILVREQNVNYVSNFGDENTSRGNKLSFVTSFSYNFKQSYKVKSVLENSPAEKAGVLAGDILLKINGNLVYKYTLPQLMEKFQKQNKKVKLLVQRNDEELEFVFVLKKRI